MTYFNHVLLGSGDPVWRIIAPEARIDQLYTTGVPFRFRITKTVETKNYDGLEKRCTVSSTPTESTDPENSSRTNASHTSTRS
jgi:hypothetical protein